MTVEQKAKAYDKALEKAKIWQEHLYDVNDKDYADELNYIFPELSESEDEKIRKDILCYFEHYAHDIKGADLQKWIAWLEKQGEQNLIMARLPQLSEHKPKFKVGDWVVFTNGNVEHIVSVGIHGYTFGDGDYLLHDKCDKDAHLWSIQDAKDGDVLLFEGFYNSIVLFQGIGINGKGRINYHCKCDLMNYSFGVQGDFACLGTIEKDAEHYHPATKEQRDFLFQKMKEAGYTFDFEKKELKKVEQEQDSINPSEYINDIGGNGCYLKNTAQVSSWSKKDEKMFEYALNMIEWYSGKNEDKSRYVSDWLKSLKQRIGG